MTIEHAPSTNGRAATAPPGDGDAAAMPRPSVRPRVRAVRLLMPIVLAIALLGVLRLLEQRAGQP